MIRKIGKTLSTILIENNRNYIISLSLIIILGLFGIYNMEKTQYAKRKTREKKEVSLQSEYYVIKGTDSYQEAIESLDEECKRLNNILTKLKGVIK